MAKTVNIYIQDDIVEEFDKLDNKSKKINELLKEYFSRQDLNSMTAEELRKFIAKQKLEREYLTKLQEIEND